jgi:hypothetical protein
MEVYYLTTLSIAKLIVAQCRWFVNEVRVWGNGRMTMTGESRVRNPTTMDTVHKDMWAG